MINLICDGQMTLGEFLAARTRLGHFKIKKTIAGGEVKVNGGRVRSDVLLAAGDAVTVYAKEPPPPYEIVYRDDNVLFVSKPRGMEVEGERSLESQLMKDGIKARAVNRLDRNTSGIVCFALNEKSRAELEKCFRDRLVTKKYRALVVGVPEPPHAVLKAFLFKDAKKSRVYVSDVRKTGYVPIETEYSVTDKHDGFCGVEIILHTGRTHQIRAHMAHIGHPVVGDGKYSSAAVNRRFGRDTQALAAVEYRFHLPPDSFLGYLNSAVIKIDAPF